MNENNQIHGISIEECMFIVVVLIPVNYKYLSRIEMERINLAFSSDDVQIISINKFVDTHSSVRSNTVMLHVRLFLVWQCLFLSA
jgi:hypothetical protein